MPASLIAFLLAAISAFCLVCGASRRDIPPRKDANGLESFYTIDHPYILVRKEPTTRSAVVAVVPRATNVHCAPTKIADSLLGKEGLWFRCAHLGYIYGPLLGKHPVEGTGLRLWVSASGYHSSGEAFYDLVAGRVQVRGWNQHAGPPYPPRQDYSRQGTYLFRSGKLEIKTSEWEPNLIWLPIPGLLPIPGAYVLETDIAKVRGILAGADATYDKEECTYYHSFDQSINLFCIK